jgi:hypothetical protein
MTGQDLLEEAARAGVRVFRDGDRVQWRADREPSAALLGKLRSHRQEILALVPNRQLAASPPKYPNARGQCFDCSAELAPGVEIGICFPCRGARNADAVPIPEADHDRLRQAVTCCPTCAECRWWRLEPGRPWICESCHPPVRQDVERLEGAAAPVKPFRVVVEKLKPASGAVKLNAWTTILDPRASIAADLGSLQAAVMRMNAAWSGRYADCHPGALDAEGLLERLRACGCEARVTSVS